MGGKVDICNLALSALGEHNFIQSLMEGSAQANHCKQHYASALGATLEDFDWPFARKTAGLAKTGEPPMDWQYQYAYPADGLKCRSLVTADRRERKLPWQIGLNEAGTAKVIHTDVDNAIMRYTRRLEDEALFPPSFVTSFSMRLAWVLAMPITRERKIMEAMWKSYLQSLSQAKAIARNEGVRDQPQDAAWIRGR